MNSKHTPEKYEPPPAVTAPAIWPRLTVSGLIASKGPAAGIAIINGRMVSVGETIEGVAVVSVVQTTVKLSYEGEARQLKVGDTTQ